jgi:tetratricopeptide (TPR) repeat protein
VLNNVRDEQQVRPLLPASPASLVLVTSRNELAGLATDGARLLRLDVLTRGEAVQLLSARLGNARPPPSPKRSLRSPGCARCCPWPWRWPRPAAARPTFPLATLAAELRDTAGRLDVLDAGDPAASVRAVFSWSYQQLNPEAARMFRLLGLHPGPDISTSAAASLAGIPEPGARRLLGELTRAHLSGEHVPGRYAFHDLLRVYAASLARDHDSQPERHAATGRVLDHYLHTAGRASTLLDPVREPVAFAPPRPGAVPERPADYQQAMAWFEAEHQVLLAAVTLADSTGFDVHTWQLPWVMTPYLDLRGHYREWAASERSALAAATRLGDTNGQAISSRLLGNACIELGDSGQARAHLTHSLGLCRRLGNRLGEASAHLNLSAVADRQGRYADALGHAEQALRLYQAIGDKAAEAVMLNNVGYCHGLVGDHQQARVFCRRALALTAETGRRIEGTTWDTLGHAEHHLGNLPEAADCYQRALSIVRESGDRWLEATILAHLGDTRHAAGELPQAREAWQQALAILEDIQHHDAGKMRAKLGGADEMGPLADP